MTVATFNQNNFTTQDATTYKAALDGNVSVLAKMGAEFAPHAQATPNMTIEVDAGSTFVGLTLTTVASQATGTFTAPVTNPRIDRVVRDPVTGVISVVTGTEASSPSAPAIPAGKVPVCQVLLQTTSTSITNSMITDERNANPFMQDLRSTASPTFAGLALAGASFSASAPANSLVQPSSGRLLINTPADNGTDQVQVNGSFVSNGITIGRTASLGLYNDGSNLVVRGTSTGISVNNFANTAQLLIITDAGNISAPNGSVSAKGIISSNGFTGSTISAVVTGANYTQSVADDFIPVNYAGTVVLTMLSAASYPGKMVTIRTYQAQAVNSASSNISINGTVGASILSATAGKWATLKSNGTNWEVIANN